MWWTRYHLTASCVDWFLLNQWLSPDFRALDTISAQSCKNDTLPSFIMLKLCYYKFGVRSLRNQIILSSNSHFFIILSFFLHKLRQVLSFVP